MLYYVLIGLCFSLIGVAALQFMYMFYIDLDRERKKRIVKARAPLQITLTARLPMRISIAKQTEFIRNARTE